MTIMEKSPSQTPSVETKRRLSPYWRHFFQMLAAMTVGMVVTGAIFIGIVGAKTWDEVVTQYPTQTLVAMAFGMTAPMAGWMLYRGMARRDAAEMSAVMLLTAVPFLLLVWFDVTKSAQCGAYCLLMIVGMLLLMRFRRDVYAGHDNSPSAQS